MSGATAAAHNQKGSPDASAVGPRTQMKGTWMSAASGIQCAFEGMGRTPLAGSLPPTSTKFQMKSTLKPWPAASWWATFT